MGQYIENLDEIKQRLDPAAVLELIGHSTKTIISGSNIRTACPVHKGTSPESFAINTQSHMWCCHSKGCKGSSLIDLYMQCKGIKFIDAAEELASHFNIRIERKEKEEHMISKEKYTPEAVKKSWDNAKESGSISAENYPYFFSKGVEPPEGVRFGPNLNGYESTLIPLRNVDGHLQGILAISGKKCMYKIDNLDGAFFQIGDLTHAKQAIIGEGVATIKTAWDVYQGETPALGAGTWSNIPKVARALKKKYPNLKLIVLIDVDSGGKGLEAAKLVAKEFSDITFRLPDFSKIGKPSGKDCTDFNDLQRESGIEEVRRQFQISYDINPDLQDSPISNSSQSLEDGSCKIAAAALKDCGFLTKIKERILDYRENPGKVRISGKSTGYKKLDEILDGLQNGHLTIVAGRTGMGKSHMALNLIKNIAIDHGIPCALFSLEMTNYQVLCRLISLCTGISATAIKNGILNDSELLKIENAIKKLETSPFVLTEDTINCNLTSLIKNIESSCKAGSKVIFVDHVGLVKVKGRSENKAVEMGIISSSLKIIAKKCNVPIICLAQLNREADSPATPKLSHLKASGDLEQDADSVIFIHRQDYYDPQSKPGQASIIIAKNRDGKVGDLTFEYNEVSWLLTEEIPLNELTKNISAHSNYQKEAKWTTNSKTT